MQEIRTWSPGAEGGDRGADGVDDPHALVAEDSPRRAGRDIALEDVQICPADRGLDNPHDRVPRRLKLGLGSIFQRLLPGPAVHQGFHRTLLPFSWLDARASRTFQLCREKSRENHVACAPAERDRPANARPAAPHGKDMRRLGRGRVPAGRLDATSGWERACLQGARHRSDDASTPARSGGARLPWAGCR